MFSRFNCNNYYSVTGWKSVSSEYTLDYTACITWTAKLHFLSRLVCHCYLLVAFWVFLLLFALPGSVFFATWSR